MEKSLLLLAFALFFAAVTTTIGARRLDMIRPDWPLWLKLALTSLVPPAAFLLFLTGILVWLGGVGIVVGSSARLHELGAIAVKLWLWGVLCAAAIGCVRLRSRGAEVATGGSAVRPSRLELPMFVGILSGVIFGVAKMHSPWMLFPSFVCGGFMYRRAVSRRARTS